MRSTPREHEVVRFISLFYLTMAGIGLALVAWRRETFAFDPLALPGEDWAVALLVTVALIVAVHIISRVAHTKVPSLRQGTRDVQRLLGQLTPTQIAAVALASGIGEEMLFRGWLLHETGFWISSIIFGIVHVPPNRQWFYWPFFAFAISLILAWLYLWSGSLVFPILLHAGINFLNLRMLLLPTARKVTPPGPDSG